jgi:hydroxyacylglutathione hydrolase
MEIIQFEDKPLAHFSYAIISDGEMAIIDPARDPEMYYQAATQQRAKITAIIETHPHADFVSSHLEISRTTGAPVYVSKHLSADYPHIFFDQGDTLELGGSMLEALNTPGHSPDSICIVAIDETRKEKAVFTGDTLFIGDCGRPDLRESAGAITAKRELLASQMYHSLREQLMKLPDAMDVYPAHGAGSLCGKGLSESLKSTIGIEKATNWSLQPMSEEEFIQQLLTDQPFVPKYFPYDVGLNKKGAPNFEESIAAIKISKQLPASLDDHIVVDARNETLFKTGHFKNAINIMEGGKFETWLGSIIAPGERFYLIAENEQQIDSLIKRAAKIGYEAFIVSAFVAENIPGKTMIPADLVAIRMAPEEFTILDVRNPSEVTEKKFFSNAIEIPLYELRERANELPKEKPVVVHCAGGYRSAAGASIVQMHLDSTTQVYDLGTAIENFNMVVL